QTCTDPVTNAEIRDSEVYFPYSDDPCYQCQCTRGKTNCKNLECTDITVCPDGSQPFTVEGECCLKCPGTCGEICQTRS
ncbi:unnamed protein product, partial [Candidula unifasciata]